MIRPGAPQSRQIHSAVQRRDQDASAGSRSVKLFAVLGAITCFLAGAFLGEERMAGRAHVAGACIALEMAQSHGALDPQGAAIVRASIVSAVNPFRDSFPIGYEQFGRQCSVLRARGAITSAMHQ